MTIDEVDLKNDLFDTSIFCIPEAVVRTAFAQSFCGAGF